MEGGSRMNKLKLKAAMALEDLTADRVCAEVGISTTSWWRKVSGKSQFTQTEICRLRQILKLSPEQTVEIFFDPEMS